MSGSTETRVVTESISTSVNSGKIVEFNVSDIENLMISADADIFWGYNDAGQAKMPLPTPSVLVITHQDFSQYAKQKNQSIRIYALKQTAGNANVYISYQGKS